MTQSPLSLQRLRDDQSGIALIVVLMVVAIMMILVIEFVDSTRINLYIASNVANGMKASYLAKSGIFVAAGAMLDDGQDDKEDHLWEEWAQALPPLPGGEGWVTVEIIDESSKFNVNKLVKNSGVVNTVQKDVFQRILTSLELDPNLVDPIIDWIDEDSEAQIGGEEDAMYGYSAQTDSYKSKNGPLLSMDELTMINGITDEIYQKIKPYITIYGDNKLNLNTVEKTVLNAYVQALTGDEDTKPASEIITWRDTEDNYFKDKKIRATLTNDVGIDPLIARRLEKFFTTGSRYFSVKTEAVVGESTKRAWGVLKRSKKKVSVIYYRAG